MTPRAPWAGGLAIAGLTAIGLLTGAWLRASTSIAAYPVTATHYIYGGHSSGDFTAVNALGFNLADIQPQGSTASTLAEIAALPAGVQGLLELDTRCLGADSTFIANLTPFLGNAKVYGYYLFDEPDAGGSSPTCTGPHLKAESDWVHANDPGKKTFIVLLNHTGVPLSPNFDGNLLNPSLTGIDYFGIDQYFCSDPTVWPGFDNGCNYTVITVGVNEAVAEGFPKATLIPVYQAFGTANTVHTAGGTWLPTAAQERQALAVWASVLPSPAWDYVYVWYDSVDGAGLVDAPDLQPVFSQKNAGH